LIEAHQELRMICDVKSLKSQIKTPSVLEEIITSSHEVFKDFGSDMAVGTEKPGNPTRETAESYIIAKRNACSEILTLEVQAKKSDL